MSARNDEEFLAFVEASLQDLRRTAYLLCGDWHRADDATQAGLIKVYVNWPKLDRTYSLWSYARRAVVTAVIDDGRRMWRRREEMTGELPEVAADDLTVGVDDRMLLREALAALPARQRAVVVLRYVDDLDIAATAFVLNCPPGTVTSAAERALAAMKKFLVARGLVRDNRGEFR